MNDITKDKIELKDITFQVHPTLSKEEMEKLQKATKVKLTSEWCECANPKFLCYPDDGQCECGIHKHHVHCVCGGLQQIG